MLGSASPGTATATIYTTTSSATPTSPTRPSRLRGLSYLRSYTHDRRLSSRPDSPSLTRSTSSPVAGSPADSPRHEPAPAPPGSMIQNGESGWVPTVQGRSGLSREGTNLTSTSTDSASPEPIGSAASMSRTRAATASGPTPATSSTVDASASASGEHPIAASSSGSRAKEQRPTIRFIPHVETRASRPSLHFTAVSRTLTNPSCVVRVGRYSERDHVAFDENVLPVGFKSKVVSRRHCEFWCTSGQWYVKDVKSSSGTFLNHVRLSSPGVESRPYPVNDGDVVQLGIDFKGGEEVIFRCVKIRIECNRGWQKSLNNFNTSTHRRLLKSVTAKSSSNRDSADAAGVSNHECSICLNPVTPCQSLFVAPCSHVWHYKCVRNLVHGPNWPNFLCPNCRFVADLEADVEPPEEDLYEDSPPLHAREDALGDAEHSGAEPSGSSDEAAGGAPGSSSETDDLDPDPAPPTPHGSAPRLASIEPGAGITDEELAGLLQHPSNASTGTLTAPTASTSSRTQPMPIASSAAAGPASKQRVPANDLLAAAARSATPTSHTHFELAAGVMADGPLTPRNDAGPFVLDGSAGRSDAVQRSEGLDGIVRQSVLEEEGGQ